MPFIIPYFERDAEHESPLFSKLEGINTCFRVDKPDLIYEVKAIGKDIFKILFI